MDSTEYITYYIVYQDLTILLVVFDNDQYHYKVYVKCTGALATLDADWLAIAIDAGVMKFDGASVVATVADLEAKGGDY